jgi:DNA-binding NarL/FixJ family response regulator/predicted DNA-binding protein (UPF0251 family)
MRSMVVRSSIPPMTGHHPCLSVDWATATLWFSQAMEGPEGVRMRRLHQAADARNQAVASRLAPHQPTTLTPLLQTAGRGEEDALGQRWQRLQPVLLRYLTLLAPGAAQDLATATWRQVVGAVGRCEGDEPAFRARVFTIARHQAIDWRHRTAEQAAATAAPSSSPSPEDAAAALSTDQGEAVLLGVVAGLEIDQVAAIMGKQPRTVHDLTRRGLGRIASSLRSVGVPDRPKDTRRPRFVDSPSGPQQPPVGVLIAHPYRVFAEGLGVVLDAQHDLAVLGVADDGHLAAVLAAEHEPTVLLLDAHMPGPDLATTLRAVKAASPATKVLMLSADTRRETVAGALEAGADGFLAKDASSRQVAEAIRKLACGEDHVVVATEPASRPLRDPSVDLRVRTLSSREREILGLLANGWSNQRIAEECSLSLNTVRTHVQDVLAKLGLHSKLEAIVFAFEHGLVLPRTDSAVGDPHAQQGTWHCLEPS